MASRRDRLGALESAYPHVRGGAARGGIRHTDTEAPEQNDHVGTVPNEHPYAFAGAGVEAADVAVHDERVRERSIGASDGARGALPGRRSVRRRQAGER